MRRLFYGIAAMALFCVGHTQQVNKTKVSITWFTTVPYNTDTRAEIAGWDQWRNSKDEVTGKRWGDLVQLAPGSEVQIEGSSLKLLQFAGGTAEDIICTHPDSFFAYRDQGFYLPLNPYIWKVRQDAKGLPKRSEAGAWDYDLDSHGKRKLLWKPWESVPHTAKAMFLRGDDVLGVPIETFTLGLHWRKDVFQAAGLDPEKPPQTWDQLFDYALKICASQPSGKTMYGFLLERNIWYLATYTMGFRADLIRHYKTYGPGGSKRIEGDIGTSIDRAPDGTDLSGIPDRWTASFDKPEFLKVMRMLRKLTLTKWVVGPDHEPIIVEYPDEPTTINSRTLGSGHYSNGEVVFASRTYKASEIRTGVAYTLLGQNVDEAERKRVLNDDRQIAMYIDYPAISDTAGVFGLQNMGFSRVPCGDKAQYGGLGGNFGSLNYLLARDPEKARLAWSALAYCSSDDYRLARTRQIVNEGRGLYCDPVMLRRGGYNSILDQVPSGLAKGQADVAKSGYPEPYAPRWNELAARFLLPVYQLALKEKEYNYGAGLSQAARSIDQEWDFAAKDYSKVKGRGAIAVGIATLFVLICFLSYKAFRALSLQYEIKESSGSKDRLNLAPYLLLAPGLCLIVLFAYYPILQGLPLAFQDYKVAGGSSWVGLANFIELVRSERTYQTLFTSIYYLLLSVGLGFLAPVILAIMLSEIPRFKYLFRTVYYLPSVVSGIVMALLWKRLLDPKPEGLMNQILAMVHLPPLGWLQDEKLALPTIVLIGIWGAAGPGTLIYLAALQSIPPDLYEAAELDGAGWTIRMRQITVSYLRPLLVINFVGAVIGAFQASQNIFVLTGGGPNFKSQTFALEIFMQAFIFMKFGYATALAWIMAALLIGFTVWQLRILRQVEFRRANVD